MPGFLGSPAEIRIMSASAICSALSQDKISTLFWVLAFTCFSSSPKAVASPGLVSQRVSVPGSLASIIE